MTRRIFFLVLGLALALAVGISFIGSATAALPADRPLPVTAPAACGTPGPWSVVSPIPTAVFGAMAAGDSTSAYAAGGYSFQLPGPSNQFMRYDPVANTWTALAPLPSADYDGAAVYANGKVYVFGGVIGGTVSSSTFIYDVATNSWSIGAPLPALREQMGVGYYSGKIYIAGGSDSQSLNPQSTLYAYDIAGNSWTTLAPMPQPLTGPGSGAVNGHLYIAGGRDESSPNRTTVYDYNIAANTWSTAAPLLTGVNVPGSAVVGGELVVFGGGSPFLDPRYPSGPRGQAPSTTNVTQVYDPVANAWSTGPGLNVARSFVGGTSVNDNYLVAVGGYDGSTSLSSVEVSTVPCGTPTPTATSGPATNTPTRTPTNTATSTVPTATNSPTRTSTRTVTVTPSAIPTGITPSATSTTQPPTATRTVTYTPTNTATRTPTNTPVPTNTATRTNTPSVTDTPLPTQTPGGPSATPIPTDTPVPPTGTPLPTQTPGGPSATPIPTGTNTAVPPTNTPGPPPPTNTPGPSPTTCTLTFSDVPPGSTFYPYVHCMVCLGIVNGYPDGTFRPNANVTRGQLSKIVSNSAGFSETPTGQQFQDVPVGSTFYVYIYRLVHRGYINGYPCGSVPSEPCVPPNNLPYFRPNNPATRGQISKIVSNAAGFNDTPSGQQFQDVAIGSTFYPYIYRLAIRNVMSGYPCGGSGEPCVPPANLPYFRPNNNATRGQTSKIVANTFFPDCNPPLR